MKILITGAYGFLGSHIKSEWEEQGHEVISIGRSDQNDICCDLSISVPKVITNVDYVVHAAGKAHHVPKTPKEEKEFFDINLKGTKNLLKSIELLAQRPRGILFVSSVSVYGREVGERIGEDHPKNADDPYGRSKIKAEELITKWGKTKKVPISIIRPALVIGKNAPGNLKQMISGIERGKYANIAKGKAKRSMVLAEDIAKFSSLFIEKPGVYNLTDGEDPSFKELSELIGGHLSKKIKNIPLPVARLMAWAGDVLGTVLSKEMPFSSRKLRKMTHSLTFDGSRAQAIGWTPKRVLAHPEIWLD